MLKKTLYFAPLLLSAATLTACNGSVDDLLASEQVDYKSTVSGSPLSLPPDLSKEAIAPKYNNTLAGPASAKEYAKQVKDAQAAQKSGAQVLPQNDDFQIIRSGSDRWLLVNKDASEVYRHLIAFWNSEGFTIKEDNPAAGIIQTDWAENRAKIPGNFLRRVVGSLIDVVSDSGERERFTTRLERNNGKTEVHISHERMIETPMDRDGNTFKWLPAKEDPGLNAVMLARYMQFAGVNKEKAEEQIRNAQQVRAYTAQSPVSNQLTIQDGQLISKLNFEQSWAKVGEALNTAGFTISGQEKASGVYTVRYLDTDNGVKRKAGNAFTRIVGSNGNLDPEEYKIRLKSQGQQTIITADNRQKADQQSAQMTANRILRVIAEHF